MDEPAQHDAAGPRRAGPSWPGSLVLAVLLIVGVNTLCRNVSSLDSFHTLPTAMSILREHDLDLDEYPRAHLPDYRIDTARGHVYNRYPLGVTLWAVPLVWVADHVVSAARGDDLEAMMKRVPPVPLEVFPASFAVALATILLMILVRREASAGTAWLLGMTFAFATPAWSSASRGLWQHGPEMMCLAAALLCLERAEARPRWLGWAGVCLGLAYWMRPLAALVIVVLAVSTVGRHRLSAGWLAAGLAAALAPFVWISWQTFGQPLPPYYTQHLLPRPAAGAFLGLWVSPSRGLLAFSPVLALSFWGIWLRLKEGRRRWLDGALAVIVLLHTLVISAWHNWWGGWSLGPRLMCDVVPFLVYFLVPVVPRLTTEGPRRRWRLAGCAALLVLSVWIHGRCANVPAVVQWNGTPANVDARPERCWDWRDPQFLRGLGG